MFKEPENGGQDININRTEEALALKPDIIATGCPFCNTMMTDGVKTVNEGAAQVKDIAEIKMPDLNAINLESAMNMVIGTARSMGVTIEG